MPKKAQTGNPVNKSSRATTTRDAKVATILMRLRRLGIPNGLINIKNGKGLLSVITTIVVGSFPYIRKSKRREVIEGYRHAFQMGLDNMDELLKRITNDGL